MLDISLEVHFYSLEHNDCDSQNILLLWFIALFSPVSLPLSKHTVAH